MESTGARLRYNRDVFNSTVDNLAGLAPDELLNRLTVPSRLGERPGLDRIRRLLAALGDPHLGLPVLHVGGTSGKGSTATIAASVLREAGYRVGLHVKPHLESVEERIIVNDVPIDRDLLAARLRQIAPAARAIAPSWYELTVALALQHFRAEQVDLAVVEVGLGGTYDGTNVVEPLVATLTNVGLDHVEVLGDTVEKIASDKAGILKPGILAVSGMVQAGPAAIVAERCRLNNVSLWQLGHDFDYQIRALTAAGGHFDLTLPTGALTDLEIGLLGAHQVANASIAVASVVRLRERGYVISDDAIRRALARVRVPGRLEVIQHRPVLVLDGAHNPDKMGALARALERLFPNRRRVGVVAFKRGHDVGSTISQVAPVLDAVVATSFEATTDFGPGQAVPPSEVARALSEAGAANVSIELDPVEAIRQALATADPTDVVCVTGSLYLVGRIRHWARGQSKE